MAAKTWQGPILGILGCRGGPATLIYYCSLYINTYIITSALCFMCFLIALQQLCSVNDLPCLCKTKKSIREFYLANLTIDMSHYCYKCFDAHTLKVRALFFLSVILTMAYLDCTNRNKQHNQRKCRCMV